MPLQVEDSTKHRYELVPIVDGEHEYPHQLVGSWKSTETGERHAEDHALALLLERPEVQRVHVYHTHPSPGPVRRYCGAVTRERGFRRPV